MARYSTHPGSARVTMILRREDVPSHDVLAQTERSAKVAASKDFREGGIIALPTPGGLRRWEVTRTDWDIVNPFLPVLTIWVKRPAGELARLGL